MPHHLFTYCRPLFNSRCIGHSPPSTPTGRFSVLFLYIFRCTVPPQISCFESSFLLLLYPYLYRISTTFWYEFGPSVSRVCKPAHLLSHTVRCVALAAGMDGTPGSCSGTARVPGTHCLVVPANCCYQLVCRTLSRYPPPPFLPLPVSKVALCISNMSQTPLLTHPPPVSISL